MSDVESNNSIYSQQANSTNETSKIDDKDNPRQLLESQILINNSSFTPHLELLNKELIIESHSENVISTETLPNDDEFFYTKLDQIDTELKLKPRHWTDDYWNNILKRYRWFIYKDDYAGCKICKNIKPFIGKKSLLSYMKLYLMTLSYEEFEQKLAKHNFTFQHIKCMDIMKERFNISIKNDTVKHLKTPTALLNESRFSEWSCPQCNKIYKFKKALVTHMYSCDPKITFLHDCVPCNCKKPNITSLVSCDLHVTKYHPNQFLFVCQICRFEFRESAVLFEHLFLKHDYFWNPYKEFPEVRLINGQFSSIDNDESQNSFTGQLDNSISGKSQYENLNYDSITDYQNRSSISGSQSDKSIVKRKHKDDPQSAKKPMQEMTNYNSPNARTIDLKSIVVCPICEGRYLCASILQTHMDRYHTN